MPSQRHERPIPIIREATAEEAACLDVPTMAEVPMAEVRLASLCALALRDALVLAGRADVAAAVLQPHLWLLWCEMIGELWAPHDASIATDPERAHAALMPDARLFAEEMIETHDNWFDQRRAEIRAWFADRRADRVTLAAELLDMHPSAEIAERLTKLRLSWSSFDDSIRLSGSGLRSGALHYQYAIDNTPQGLPVVTLRPIRALAGEST
jgi:hypothetical protein